MQVSLLEEDYDFIETSTHAKIDVRISRRLT